MPPIKNIVELRRHLAERFPQLRSASEQIPETSVSRAGGSELSFNDLMADGLPRGILTELVEEHPSAGSSFVLAALVRRLCVSHWVALVDGHDSFDPAGFDNGTLSRLLWARCHGADEALRAADLLLRDRNVPFVLLDLALTSPKELRKISPTTWHRFQRIVEHGGSALLVVLPCHLVSCARLKFVLDTPFGLEALAQTESELLRRMDVRLEQRLLAAARDDEQKKIAHAG